MVLCTYDSGQNGADSGPQTYTNMESVTETYSVTPSSFPAIKPGIVSNCPSKPIANNNNSNDNQNTLSEEEKLLLAKLEEANRLIETDSKSLNSISGASGHSRRSSDTSQISVTSGASSGGCAASNGAEESEEDAWTLWGQIVNDWENYSKKKNGQLKELVRRGVPHHFRGIVWQLLCGAYNSPAKQQYAEFIKSSSPCEKVIRRDIARTYPEHEFFKEKDGLGQESLFNVMKAYSLHDREVGYCQGSAFIVGLLLMQMPEEDAFAVFVKVMQDFRMREMFKPSMSELGLCMYQLESMVKDLLPELHIHFQAQSFHTSMYASSWFLTLFTTALPLQLAFRIMDVFLSEGVEIIFRIAVAILMSGRDTLLQLDMEGMLKYFQKEAPAYFENDADGLMYLAFSVKYNPKKMKKLEKDYTVMKTKEHEEMVELRRLRTENRLLRQRIDDLEAETAMLADKLVQGQVSRAEEAESNFVIMRELAAIRQHDLETSQQLNEARDRIQKLSCIMEENSSKESSLQEISLKSEIIQQKEELIRSLQEGLVNVRLREAENDALIRDLRARIQELEEDKKKLRETTPDNSVAHLQEELIAVKLREAESTLALKELRQKVSDLNVQWQKRIQDNEAANQEAGSSATKKLMFWDTNRSEAKYEEEIMSLKLRETEAVAELNELRHRVMELEAQMQVSVNQVKRAESELMKCREELDDCETSKRQLCQQLRDQERKYSDLESKMKEELMLARIRDAEHSQGMAELTQKISGLECKNQELVAEGELSKDQTHSDTVKDLQDKIAELTAEVMRLKMTNRKLSVSLSVLNLDSPSRSSPDETEDELNFHFDDPAPARSEH